MEFWKVEDFIHNRIDWDANAALQQEFPYFSIPFILEWIRKNETQNFKELSRFHTNAVLIATLEKDFYSEKSTSSTSNEIAEHLEAEFLTNKDYYSLNGVSVSDEMPNLDELQSLKNSPEEKDENNEIDLSDKKALLVQMSFQEWLHLITKNKEKEKEELREQEELKNRWRKNKLAEALEEEPDDIPEDVFKMAVESIEKEELVSESMAEVYILQGKFEQAINIYKKLILQIPEKKVYFASKIDIIRNNHNV